MKTKTKLIIGLPLLAGAVFTAILTTKLPEYEEAFSIVFTFFFFAAAFVFVKDSTRSKLNWLLISLSLYLMLEWFFFIYQGLSGEVAFPFASAISLLFVILLTIGLISFSNLWSNLRETLGSWAVVKALVSFLISYFIFIFIFALVFASIYLVKGPMSFYSDKPLVLLDFFYFSAVTATTLGYGDVTPVANVAKLLTIIQVFLSMVIVALYFGVVITKIQEDGGGEGHEEKTKKGKQNGLFKSTSALVRRGQSHLRARRPRPYIHKTKPPGRANKGEYHGDHLS